MNVLMLGNGQFREVARQLVEQGNNLFLISDAEPDFPVGDYQHFRDCTFGRFKDKEKYSANNIDAETLSSLRDCESTCLKMMERYNGFQNLITFDARIDLYHKQVQYWYNYLLTNQIEWVVFPVIPHVVFDYTIYSVAKYLNIKTTLTYRTTIVLDGNISIYAMDDIDKQVPELEQRYLHHLEHRDEAELSDRMLSYYSFREENHGVTFKGITKRSYSKFFSLSAYVSGISYRVTRLKEWINYLTYQDIVNRLASILRRKRATPAGLADPDLTKAYVYVALHYQPECSTSPMGGDFVHQDLMIKMLSSILPARINIFIKGHIREGVGEALLRRLELDQRTYIVDSRYSSGRLVKNAFAVATVTGTSGFEAFMNNVPVLMFGSYFYQHAPGVFKVKSNKDLVNAIETIQNHVDLITEEKIVAFLKALDELSIEGWVDNRYGPMSNLTPTENCARITKLISSRSADSPSF